MGRSIRSRSFVYSVTNRNFSASRMNKQVATQLQLQANRIDPPISKGKVERSEVLFYSVRSILVTHFCPDANPFSDVSNGLPSPSYLSQSSAYFKNAVSLNSYFFEIFLNLSRTNISTLV